MRNLVFYAQKDLNSYGLYEIYKYTYRNDNWFVSILKKKNEDSDDVIWREHIVGYTTNQIIYVLENNYSVYSIDEITDESKLYERGESFEFIKSYINLYFDMNDLLNMYFNGKHMEILRYINKHGITYNMFRYILWGESGDKKDFLLFIINRYKSPDDIFTQYNGFIPEYESEVLHDANIRLFDSLILKGEKVFLIDSKASKLNVFEYNGQRLYNFCCQFYTTNKDCLIPIPLTPKEISIWLFKKMKQGMIHPVFWV